MLCRKIQTRKKVKQQQWPQQNKSTSTVENKDNLDKLLHTVPSFYLYKFAAVTKKDAFFVSGAHRSTITIPEGGAERH